VIALDLSRLLSRSGSATPSGIDRVEIAYAQHLIAGTVTHGFAAHNPLGGIGLLPTEPVHAFVAKLAAAWRGGATEEDRRRIALLTQRLRLAALAGGPALRRAFRDAEERAVYLLVSHQNLDRPQPIARLKAMAGTRFVAFIHDLIPLDFPELTRPGQTQRHRRRIATVARLADAVIVNSTATGDALRPHLRNRKIPIAVAPLGIDPSDDNTPSRFDAPHFVCIGTVEARKNHRLLLDVWEHLRTELGTRTPRLHLIGQRGFGREPLVRHLGGLHDVVTEHRGLPDTVMVTLLRGARALLLPSFAEGFGLPVAEALALGVPVLCSNLAAIRESGGGVPDYLDPHDPAAWRRAILDYTADSPRRQAQFARLADWRPPRWADHFDIVDQLVAAL